MYTLVIGNRNYSSWSLRAWLALRHAGVEFNLVRIPLFQGNWKSEIAAYSPAGRVPVLLDSDLRIWDSSAIIEHLREHHDSAPGYPMAPASRAEARSVSAEMHAGFMAIRDELPQNLRVQTTLDTQSLTLACRDQISRIDAIWSGCYQRHGGPWLFGEFGIADIMYVPVALRFLTYGISVSDGARRFIEAVKQCAIVREWVAEAGSESEVLDFVDQRMSADQSPLTQA